MTIAEWEGLVPRSIVCKFEENPFTSKEVMAKIKVLHHADADDNNDDIRAMAIPQLFSSKKQPS